MLEIIAFIVTFGGMLLYGFGHAFDFANRNRVIRKTVENVVEEKMQSRHFVQTKNVQRDANSLLNKPMNTQAYESSIDFELIKNHLVNNDWDFAKKAVFESGEDHTELYKEIKSKNEATTQFKTTVLTAEIDEQLEKLFNEVAQSNDIITHVVGPNVAAFITNSISNLETNKTSIIVGKIKDNKIDDTLELSDADEIICGEDDLMILKGLLLPNNKFRVISSEDADTCESGYSDIFPIKDKQII